MVSRVLSRMANYEGGLVPNIEQENTDEDEEEEDQADPKKCGAGKKKKKKKGSKEVNKLLIHWPILNY